MVCSIAIVLVLAVALIGSGGRASALSGEANVRACLGQFTAEKAQMDGLRPIGENVISPAAQEPNFGNLQSYVAVRCDLGPLAKRYSI